MFLVCVDDCIIINKNNSGIADTFIESLRTETEKFQLEDEITTDKFCGVNIKKNENGSIDVTAAFNYEVLRIN